MVKHSRRGLNKMIEQIILNNSLFVILEEVMLFTSNLAWTWVVHYQFYEKLITSIVRSTEKEKWKEPKKPLILLGVKQDLNRI